MAGILNRGLPPGLAGYLVGQEANQRESASGLAQLGGILGLQNAMRQAAMDEKLKPLQIEQLRLQIEGKRRQQEALLALLPGMGGGNTGGAVDSQGTTVGGQRMGVLSPAGGTDEKFAALLTSGVDPKLVTALRDITNPQMQVTNGYAYNPRAIGPGYMPGLNVSRDGQASQVTIGTDGQPIISAPAGAVQTYGGFQDARNASEARFQPFLGQLDAQGRPIPQTVLQFTQGVGGTTSPSAPALRTTAPTEAEALRIAQEADARGQPVSVTTAPRAGMGLTPGQKSAAETSGREEAQLVSGYRQKIPALNTTLRRLEMLERMNGNDQTYAAAGAEFKTMLGSIAQTFGLEVAKDKTATSELYLAQIGELMKDRLASKDYGSGSGVSNLDLLAARQPLPELAKTRDGRAAIIQAIRADTQASVQDLTTATQHFDRNLSLSGFQYPSSTARETRQRDLDATVRSELPRPPTARPTGRVVKWSEL